MSPGILTVLAVSMAARTVLLWVILHRRIYRDLPAFAIYVAFSWISSITMFVLENTGHPYFQFYWYWCDEAICILLDCWIVYEIFQRVLRTYPAMREIGVVVLRATFALMGLAAGFIFVYGAAAGLPDVYGQIVAVARSGKVAQLLLVCALLVFCATFRVPLRRDLRGIALGIGLLAAVNVAGFAVFAQFGRSVVEVTNYVLMINYIVVQGIWIYALAPSRLVAATAQMPCAETDNWNAALSELVTK